MSTDPPSRRSHSRNSYTIAWISALPHEQTAAIAMLDNEHARPPDFTQPHTDNNSYVWGDINSFNVVIASLPAGEYGAASAAGTAVTMLSSFPQIRFGLMVGIGAGVPRPGRDVRLGDIVVSRPEGASGGVVQYDFGKALQGGEFRRTGFLNSPPRVLRSAVSSLQARHGLQASNVPQYLNHMVNKFPLLSQPNNNGPSYTHQGIMNDRLFNPTYTHESGDDCLNCDPTQLQSRVRRGSNSPVIHYGVIASGNMLIRNPELRAEMVRRTGEDCICFEMEAAGLMNQFPCLVIRGICDYADSHKNDQWQRYAAATAAAYTKELIQLLPAQAVAEADTAANIVNQAPTPGGQGQVSGNNEIQQLRGDIAGLTQQMNTVIQLLQSARPPSVPSEGSGGGGSGEGGSGSGGSGGQAIGYFSRDSVVEAMRNQRFKVEVRAALVASLDDSRWDGGAVVTRLLDRIEALVTKYDLVSILPTSSALLYEQSATLRDRVLAYERHHGFESGGYSVGRQAFAFRRLYDLDNFLNSM
ncbi:nucleoside phosphorylase domain-containing protein [Trichoderma chlorosporum]